MRKLHTTAHILWLNSKIIFLLYSNAYFSSSSFFLSTNELKRIIMCVLEMYFFDTFIFVAKVKSDVSNET